MIIDHVENKNPKDIVEITPLHLAAEEGHLSICKLFLKTTGLFIIIGTTFGGCTEPQSDLTKNLFNDYMKIIIKISYGYQIKVLSDQA